MQKCNNLKNTEGLKDSLETLWHYTFKILCHPPTKVCRLFKSILLGKAKIMENVNNLWYLLLFLGFPSLQIFNGKFFRNITLFFDLPKSSLEFNPCLSSFSRVFCVFWPRIFFFSFLFSLHNNVCFCGFAWLFGLSLSSHLYYVVYKWNFGKNAGN